MLLLMLIAGALVVGWIGETLVMFVPVLEGIGRSYSVGIPRFTVDLKILTLTLGFALKLNLFSLLGLVAGFFVYRKM